MACVLLALALPAHGQAQATRAAAWSFGGHVKLRGLYTRIPADSLLRSGSGKYLATEQLQGRLKLSVRQERWDLDLHAQVLASRADEPTGLPSVFAADANLLPNDKRRWFDLTRRWSAGGRHSAQIRLDRASVGYSSERLVLRLGRQALSWGNGLLFTPMDIFNPFDPAAIDREYKNGDDMLYTQWLLANGNDLQAVGVIRRDPDTGHLSSAQSSLAFKFHGFFGANEYDLLLAEHYDDRVVGAGISADAAGAVWRSDLVWTDTQQGSEFSAMAGMTYSWSAWHRNWSGVLEYFYNGFGLAGGDYSAAVLSSRPQLQRRLARGELYNLGRHYLGGSVDIEVTPLLTVSPNIFINLGDPSALGQLVVTYDWLQNVQLIVAVSVPIGPAGTEFG
ncbi:MAG: hypothetical protein PVF89_06245, partial [Lysobacterales bacterium]